MFLLAYFMFGAGMYVGMALNNPMSFLDANAASLIRGLLICFVFWPIGLIVKLITIMVGTDEKD